MNKEFIPASVYPDSKREIQVITVDGVLFGYVSLDTATKVFENLVQDKKNQLTQDLGVTPVKTTSTDLHGNISVFFKTLTTSNIRSGYRIRGRLEMKKIRLLRV